jgi:hypothetical protein
MHHSITSSVPALDWLTTAQGTGFTVPNPISLNRPTPKPWTVLPVPALRDKPR